MARILIVAFVASAFALTAPLSSRADECADLLPRRQAPAPVRSITADDLAHLRDFGPLDAVYPGDKLYALSPDRSLIAFQIRKADTVTNNYCSGVVIMPLAKPDAARLVDTGGDLIRIATQGAGFADLPSGMPYNLIPKWSPDGQWLAYLRRDLEITQIWRARADGSDRRQVTHSPVDVESFDWADAGQSLTFASRPERLDRQAAIEIEGQGGYLYDDRFSPLRGARPWVRGDLAAAHYKVEVSSGLVSEISGAQNNLDTSDASTSSIQVLVKLEDRTGGFINVETEQAGRPRPVTYLIARKAGGRNVRCEAQACRSVKTAWLSHDGAALFFLNQEPVQPKLGLYRWDMKEPSPHLILQTEDALGGCELISERLVCVREASSRPRHFVNIDLKLGTTSVLFDPNPEYQSLRLGSIQRLRWTNTFGIETFGDLVLPPDYNPGQGLPLIIVGYYSRGFLRGGTGDEYPIQLYASAGFAVLSFHRPISIGWVKGGKSYDEISKIDREEYADRRSVQSSLETAIDLLARRGIVDETRVGLTGFSDGASTAQFAMVNSSRFSAMVVSSCCENTLIVNALVGPAIGGWLNSLGYPTLTAPDASYWNAFAIRPNLEKVRVPLLIQTSDDEYLGALEDFAALRERKRPVEMHVFEGEHHVKWQPSHRKALYARSLDWFDFWLNRREDSNPAKADQYIRWRALRSETEEVTSTSPGE